MRRASPRRAGADGELRIAVGAVAERPQLLPEVCALAADASASARPGGELAGATPRHRALATCAARPPTAGAYAVACAARWRRWVNERVTGAHRLQPATSSGRACCTGACCARPTPHARVTGVRRRRRAARRLRRAAARRTSRARAPYGCLVPDTPVLARGVARFVGRPGGGRRRADEPRAAARALACSRPTTSRCRR